MRLYAGPELQQGELLKVALHQKNTLAQTWALAPLVVLLVWTPLNLLAHYSKPRAELQRQRTE